MKTKQILLLAMLAVATISANAQSDSKPLFGEFKLEARADFNYSQHESDDPLYGFRGRYFNLHLGGSLGNGFDYYLRQRLIAKPGTVGLFDNTDFLYLSYNVSPHFRLRAGKDALAVGGYEYDARPIDVYFNTTYWDNFYCFQIGFSAAYINDGQTFMFQVANSPAVHSLSPNFNFATNRLSYNLYWAGSAGPVQTLWSANLFQRDDGNYMGYIALGNRLDFNHWAIYVDLIHHSVAADDWGKNYCLVSRLDLKLGHGLSCFVKGAYEQNKSDEDLTTFAALDLFVPAGSSYLLYGAGLEYRPDRCPDARLHAFFANRKSTLGNIETNDLTANIGVTWDINFLKLKRK
ncbi:MAG: hypothetical protein IJ789_07430 [Bacteroidales bacterium]|nr:hypothetical protein [Bacteroidales bacterium]